MKANLVWWIMVDKPIPKTVNITRMIGKLLDHTSDKIAMFAVLYQAWKKNIGPKAALTSIAAINAANAGITLAALKTKPGEELSANKPGKRFMAAQAIALASYMTAEKTRNNRPIIAMLARFIGHTSTIASIAYGLRSTIQYARWLQEPKKANN